MTKTITITMKASAAKVTCRYRDKSGNRIRLCRIVSDYGPCGPELHRYCLRDENDKDTVFFAFEHEVQEGWVFG